MRDQRCLARGNTRRTKDRTVVIVIRDQVRGWLMRLVRHQVVRPIRRIFIGKMLLTSLDVRIYVKRGMRNHCEDESDSFKNLMWMDLSEER